uniref:Uncharacterized protein n=1 Tax=Anguilla anguilla TaxID=7936 RepID=A0A0E9W002_ANGAN
MPGHSTVGIRKMSPKSP